MISVLTLKEEVTEKRLITKVMMRGGETLKMFTMMRMIATPSVIVCQSERAGTCPASPSQRRRRKGLKSRRRRVDAAAALRSLGWRPCTRYTRPWTPCPPPRRPRGRPGAWRCPTPAWSPPPPSTSWSQRGGRVTRTPPSQRSAAARTRPGCP